MGYELDDSSPFVDQAAVVDELFDFCAVDVVFEGVVDGFVFGLDVGGVEAGIDHSYYYAIIYHLSN